MSRIETSRSSRIETSRSSKVFEPGSSNGTQSVLNLGFVGIDFEGPADSDEMRSAPTAEGPSATISDQWSEEEAKNAQTPSHQISSVFRSQGLRSSRRQALSSGRFGMSSARVQPEEAAPELADDFACLAILQQQHQHQQRQSRRSTIRLRLQSKLGPNISSASLQGFETEESSPNFASLSIPSPSDDLDGSEPVELIGTRVAHPVRGEGHVLNIDLEDPRGRPIHVGFDNGEVHHYTLEAAAARLEKVEQTQADEGEDGQCQ
jgi:hypothetical protein